MEPDAFGSITRTHARTHSYTHTQWDMVGYALTRRRESQETPEVGSGGKKFWAQITRSDMLTLLVSADIILGQPLAK
jgi:hypothetical protein